MTRFLLTIVDTALLTLAVLRLSRFITRDDLTKWYVLAPLYDWLIHPDGLPKDRAVFTNYAGTAIPKSWQIRLASGLTCPFCIGWHIGLWMILLAYWVGPLGQEPVWWRILMGSLAMNWVVGHVASRVGDTDPNAPF